MVSVISDDAIITVEHLSKRRQLGRIAAKFDGIRAAFVVAGTGEVGIWSCSVLRRRTV
jgi:hypothetical protein